ncbi:hypothetical protein H4582DRAFT_2072008 [Lactarius indigo]|nr:hypothetical protein H4582DRAFT_2072008 [Lactarius indigo]
MSTRRPERSWRSIITLEVDGRHKHEVVLGVDCQNTNTRDIMLLYVLLSYSWLVIWHPTAIMCTIKRKSSWAFGTSSKSAIPFPIDHNHHSERLSLASSGDEDPSDTLVTTPIDGCEGLPPWSSVISEEPPPGLRRRKKVKAAVRQKISRPVTFGNPKPYDKSSDDIYPDSLKTHTNTNEPSTISVIFLSLLLKVMSLFLSRLALTYHRELREAQATQSDSDFGRVLVKLVQECYFPSLCDVDTTVFGFSSGNLSNVNSGVAKRALIISSVASAIGLFVDKFVVDLYGSYFFSVLFSRLPLVALFVAFLALAIFLGAITWTAWPAAVLVMCVLAGLLVSLQFIVYGCHHLALGLAWVVGGARLGVLYVSRPMRAVFVRGAAAAAQLRTTGGSAYLASGTGCHAPYIRTRSWTREDPEIKIR